MAKNSNVLIIETKVVRMDSLQMYYMNPKIGDVDEIAKSLDQNGQFKPILVNKGSKTGRKDEILAGNHTWLAGRKELTYKDSDGHICKKEVWSEILASFVDVDEETAKKIVLADNKTATLGGYDDQILAQIFSDLEDVTGTGYKSEEIEDILKNLPSLDDAAENLKGINDFIGDLDETEKKKLANVRADLDEDPDDEDDSEDDGDAPKHTRPNKPQPLVQGEYTNERDTSAPQDADYLPSEIPADYVGFWQIPAIRPDMLVEFSDLPEKLDVWPGLKAVKDPGMVPKDQWWLWNWGIENTRGMNDTSQAILAFFTAEDKFDTWFSEPSRYTGRVLDLGITKAVSPVYPIFADEPRASKMFSLYCGRWIARYLQEAGVKIIPGITLDCDDLDFLKEHVLGTLPADMPCIALNLGHENTESAKSRVRIQLVFDELSPGGALLYGNDRALNWFTQNIKPGCPTYFVKTLK